MMFKVRIPAILGVFFLFFMAVTYADTIYLKNGKNLQGIITKENKDDLEINVGGGTVVFQTHEIERIEKSVPQEIQEIKKNWEMEKIRIEKTKESDREEKEKASEKWTAMVEEEMRQGEERRYMDAGAKTVSVTSDKKGHILVGVVLNEDIHALLIVDTGCPVVLLTAHVARKLGIDLENIHDAGEVSVLDGKHKVKQVILKSVKAGDVEEKNIMAEVLLEDTREIKQQMKDGLLGMSFLKKFDVTLDQKKMKLIFKPRL